MQRAAKTLESLPEVSAASPLIQEELTSLIRKAHQLRQAVADFTEVKTKLTELILANGLASDDGLNGARTGKLGVILVNRKGRKVFDKALAIDAGITPLQLEQSYKLSKDSTAVELFEIGASWSGEET